ncbi:hypothetical protein PUN28_020446 [Cardiocondyla obscurior]|uniref:Uncharacterized protein n=1 Tax=Cardiocondyla obscurior TaxID=286306 RepID=A0AAW2E8C0_9HYME
MCLKIWQKNHRSDVSRCPRNNFSKVLPSPEILTKTEKIFENRQKSSCGDVSKCPRNKFLALSPLTRNKNIDKKQKKILKILQRIIVSDDVSRCPHIDKKRKKNEKSGIDHCAVTSADAHVTIFSVLLSPKTKKILDKKRKKIIDNLATNLRAVSADAHVTIFSVIFTNAKILTKTKKKALGTWQRIFRAVTSVDSRDYFQRSTLTRNITKNESIDNLATNLRAVTRSMQQFFSVLPSPEAEILTNEKICQNLATYHCAVTSADAHM